MRRQGLIFVGAMIAGIAIGLGSFGIYLALRGGSFRSHRLDAEIGSVRLHLDRASTRFGEQRLGGRLERLDLAFLLPDFRPAGVLSELGRTLDQREMSEKMVFMSITEPDGRLDPADRFIKLYARFLSPDQLAGPAGLIRRRFEPSSPFANEDLYLAAPEGRQFAARCRHRPADGPLPDTCSYEYWRDGVAVQLRFAPSALADWQALKARSQAVIADSTN